MTHLNLTSAVTEALVKAGRFEGYYPMKDWVGGWSPERLGLSEHDVLCLVEEGLAKRWQDGYQLTSSGIESFQNLSAVPQRIIDIPDEIFSAIIGHEDVKELLSASLRSSRPVHVLLAGPPALAKSLFLWEIETVYQEQAVWLLGNAVSQAGMWDLLADRQPRVLLIDELDKLRPADQAALLSLMEEGRLVRAKKGRELDISLVCWVIASVNDPRKLSPELLSRFAYRELKSYSRADFIKIATAVLVKREQVDKDMAAQIAKALDGVTQNIRDAIRVARLAQTVGVKRAVELLQLN